MQNVWTSAVNPKRRNKNASVWAEAHNFRSTPNGMMRTIWFSSWNFQVFHINGKHPWSLTKDSIKYSFHWEQIRENVIHENPIVVCVTFLRRALKKKGNTPKYGLIFHSSFIGRAGTKNKGRISRYLANKCSIASRIDCFSGNVKSGEVHRIYPDYLHFLLKYSVAVP